MGKLAPIAVMCIALIVAFYTTTIVPDGFSQPWRLRTLLTAVRFSTKLAQLSTIFGFEEAHVLRNLAKLYSSPKHQDNDTHVHLYDTDIQGVPVRLFWPVESSNKKDLPGIVFIHGGGWSIGDVAGYSLVTYELSKQLNAFVISVEYRLAPENIFPIPMDDCFAVTKYVLQNAKKFNVDPSRIAVMGDSAGGNLAAAVALRLRDEKVKPALKLQILIYPSIQATDFNTPSMQYNQHGPFLTKTSTVHFKNLYAFGHFKYIDMAFGNNHTSPQYKKYSKVLMNHAFLPDDEIKQSYVPIGDDFGDAEFWKKYESLFKNPYFGPLHANNFQNLPTTYISTCQLDVLRDDGFFYAGLLRKSGIKVNFRNELVCFHGWMNFIDILQTAEEMFISLISDISKDI